MYLAIELLPDDGYLCEGDAYHGKGVSGDHDDNYDEGMEMILMQIMMEMLLMMATMVLMMAMMIIITMRGR